MAKKQKHSIVVDYTIREITESDKVKFWKAFWDANHLVAQSILGLSEQEVKPVWERFCDAHKKRPTWHEISSGLTNPDKSV